MGYLINVPWILLSYRWPLSVRLYIVKLHSDETYDKMTNLGVMLFMVCRLLASFVLRHGFYIWIIVPFFFRLTIYLSSYENAILYIAHFK
jgi:hypothetical protein